MTETINTVARTEYESKTAFIRHYMLELAKDKIRNKCWRKSQVQKIIDTTTIESVDDYVKVMAAKAVIEEF